MIELFKDLLPLPFSDITSDIVYAIIIFIALTVIFKLFQLLILQYLKHLAKKTHNDLDDTFIEMVSSIRSWFYPIVAFFLALYLIEVPDILRNSVTIITILSLVYQLVTIVNIFIEYSITKKLTADEKHVSTSLISLIKTIVAVLIWIVGILFALSNVGVNVTSLLTGLGVGGLAIALAMQNILSDLFSSLAIFFDKPFSEGDFIELSATDKGFVEKIGIKTTRIRSQQGEELIVSNQELTSARVRNLKRIEERRVQFIVGVAYDTPASKLKTIPDIFKNIVGKYDHTRYDRGHLSGFGDSALIFEFVYMYDTDDFSLFKDTHEKILAEILEIFEQQKIEIAFPTQTIHVKQEHV